MLRLDETQKKHPVGSPAHGTRPVPPDPADSDNMVQLSDIC